jgi:hypothetical protein
MMKNVTDEPRHTNSGTDPFAVFRKALGRKCSIIEIAHSEPPSLTKVRVRGLKAIQSAFTIGKICKLENVLVLSLRIHENEL